MTQKPSLTWVSRCLALAVSLGVVLIPCRVVAADRDKADSLFKAEKYQEALTVLERVRSSMEREGRHDTAYANVLVQDGACLALVGRVAVADSSVVAGLAILERNFPDHHRSVINALRWLSYIYMLKGDEADAEVVLKRGLAAWQEAVPPDTSYALRALLQVGVLCMNQGRLQDAEDAYRTAMGIIAANPRAHADMASKFRNNMANLYRYLGRLDEVEKLLLDQIAEVEQDTAASKELLSSAYHNLAELYAQEDRNEESEAYFLRALDTNRSRFGPDDFRVAFNLTSLGNLYMKQLKLEQASDMYREALRIKRQSAGLADRSVANTLVMYSRCQHALGNMSGALELAKESFRIRYDNFVKNSWALPEDRALTYAQIMRSAADAFLSPFLERSNWDDSIVTSAADIILASKGQVSDEVFDRQRALLAAGDPAVEGIFKQYTQGAEDLSAMYSRGPGSEGPVIYTARLDSLSHAVDSLESDLARAGGAFRDLHAGAITFDRLRALLPPRTVLIEYMKYRRGNLAEGLDEDWYLALVIAPRAAPTIVNLGEAARLEPAVQRIREIYQTMAESWPQVDKQQRFELTGLNRSLYRKLIQPVRQSIGDAALLLLAPDASLNLLSFATLQDDSGRYMIEQWPIHYLTAARDLVRRQLPFTPGRGLLAVGDIDYGAAAAVGINQSLGIPVQAPFEDSTKTPSAALRTAGRHLEPLPYTGREIQEVARAFEAAGGDQAILLTQAAASEKALIELAAGKRFLHLATHGFFQADSALPYYVTDDEGNQAYPNPLLRSGLYLAGANWINESTATDHDDGCLTAWEVTAMNLQGTEWVVLSACESGLGELRAGEGVYGLRRAFLMAGARTVICSLWPIPDKQTAKIVGVLYSGGDDDLAHRLRRIALDYIAEGRAAGIDDPFSWGAFIAVGDWSPPR